MPASFKTFGLSEREADKFTSALFMPRNELRAKVPQEPSVAQVLELKNHFGVSAMALVYSAHKAGILTDWTYRLLMQELTDAGFKSGEPDGRVREASRVRYPLADTARAVACPRAFATVRELPAQAQRVGSPRQSGLPGLVEDYSRRAHD